MGNPHPNLTNSFVSFFINSFRDLKDKTLLEIGSGESTVTGLTILVKCVAMRMIHNGHLLSMCQTM